MMTRIVGMGLLTFALHCFGGQVRLHWNPPESGPDLAGYYLYESLNFFEVDPLAPLQDIDEAYTNTTAMIEIGQIHAFHLTAYNTYGLESDPSNEIRFQLLTLPSKGTNANDMLMLGFTNWASAVLTKPPTNGIIVGVPPNIQYYRTNFASYKDGFIYNIEKRDLVSDGRTKVYTVMDARNQTITVDGNLSEWPSNVYELVNPVFYIPKTNGVTPVTFEAYNTPTNSWNGPSDHSITIKACYQGIYAYLGIIVRDDFHENTRAGYWQGDSVQILVANSNRTSVVASLGFALTGTDNALGTNRISSSNTNFPPTFAVVRDTTNKITTYEIRIDRQLFDGNIVFGNGEEVGLGICVNESDMTYQGQTGWSGFGPHAVVFGQSPSETALFRFVDEWPVKNYFTIYFVNPNMAPSIITIEDLTF